jgi:chromosome segregation protein
VPAETVRALCTELLDACDAAIAASDISEVQRMVRRLSDTTRGFLASLTQPEAPVQDTSIAETIRIEKEHIEAEIAGLEGTLVTMRSQADMLRNKLGQIDTKIRDAERASYAGAAKLATLEGSLRECKLRKESLEVRKATLAEEIREAEALVGLVVGNTGEKTEDTPEKLAARQTLHHKIERIKIKLEDSGVASGSEILKEYEETKERDAFLAREVIDIDTSITALKNLIADLRETIDRTFKEGIEKINVQFGEFFKLMFSGGSAFLSIVVEHKRNRGEEGEEGDNDDSLPFEHGIEINVSLPHKKVRDLAMFSGGERSLVSIALLFAMSQVNPPPFLVLDETDAALDEANSRRYGDMLALLSEHSKLVVVTHNRETMSRAQVLYGVTMGLDGASKLLSIKFDEAIKIAK